jgi:murein DD-endopeptidase MepM/ murein hydrolase activator NlpD
MSPTNIFSARRKAAVALLGTLGLLVGVIGGPAAAQTDTTSVTEPPPPTSTTPTTSPVTTTVPPTTTAPPNPGGPQTPPTSSPPPLPSVEPPALPDSPELDGLRGRIDANNGESWSLRYSDAELDLWASTLSSIIGEKRDRVTEIEEDLQQAQNEIARLQQVITGIEREIDALEQVVRGRVVEAYMESGSRQTAAAVLLSSSNPTELEFRQFLVGVANKSDNEVLDDLDERRRAVRDEKERAENKEREIAALKDVADRELAELSKAEEDLVDRPASAQGLIWPVDGVLTSVFGMRWGVLHAGIDIGAPSGTPIYAAADGTVLFSGAQGGYGNIVIVDHGYGFHTAYAHMTRTIAVNGSQVRRGELIGLVGSTGNSTGPHLHFETRVYGRPYDPLQYLPSR